MHLRVHAEYGVPFAESAKMAQQDLEAETGQEVRLYAAFDPANPDPGHVVVATVVPE